MERLTEKITNIETEKILAYRLKSKRDEIKAVRKLGFFEDAEEQGLLKILPCPIGTTVHEPYRFCNKGAWEIDHHRLKLEDLDKIGKTVFVDLKDAEAYAAEQEAKEYLEK